MHPNEHKTLLSYPDAAALADCSVSMLLRILKAEPTIRVVSLNPHASDQSRAAKRVVKADLESYLQRRAEAGASGARN